MLLSVIAATIVVAASSDPNSIGDSLLGGLVRWYAGDDQQAGLPQPLEDFDEKVSESLKNCSFLLMVECREHRTSSCIAWPKSLAVASSRVWTTFSWLAALRSATKNISSTRRSSVISTFKAVLAKEFR